MLTARLSVACTPCVSVIRSDKTFLANGLGRHSENFSSETARSETGVRSSVPSSARTSLSAVSSRSRGVSGVESNDEVIDLAKGGRSRLENAALMCRACNSAKGSRRRAA